jgi:integrase
MSLYLRGKIWWSRIEVKGITHQFSTKETDKINAGQAEYLKRKALIAGLGLAPTLREFEERFLKSLTARVSKQTDKFYQCHWKPLVKFPALAECRLDQITPAVIEDFVQWRSKQPGRSGQTPAASELKVPQPARGLVTAATINHNLRTLSRALHLAADWGVIARVPKIKLLTGENQREYVLTDEVIEQFANGPALVSVMVPFMCDTGLRRSEACNLTWDAVNLNLPPHSIEIRKGKTKAARRRIPLTARAQQILTALQAIRQEKPEAERSPYVFHYGIDHISPSWMSHTFLAVRRRLGLPDTCVLHSTRHTFCTRLGERGADAFAIQRLAGHSSITISQRYVHASGPRLDAAIGLLEPAQL